MPEPYSDVQAKALVRKCLKTGTYLYRPHALEEMEKDDICQLDIVNALRCGIWDDTTFETGTWRYRFRTNVFKVVVAFPDEDSMRIVTAWRIKR
jgi:hypothetical protein